MRVAVAALVAAMLLATPGVARADESTESRPPGACVIVWVKVLGIPIGFHDWHCVALEGCNAGTGSGPVSNDILVEWRVGVSTPNPFSPNVFCALG